MINIKKSDKYIKTHKDKKGAYRVSNVSNYIKK
jgi:hypothetical protein